jgi:hypothetical protein
MYIYIVYSFFPSLFEQWGPRPRPQQKSRLLASRKIGVEDFMREAAITFCQHVTRVIMNNSIV